MAKLTLVDPVVGEKVTASDPKIVNAFVALQEWANGNIGLENMENKGVTKEKLSSAVQTELGEKTAGGTLKKSIIATEQERESAVYGTLTTPDEVEITLVENGLLAVWYQAIWGESVAGAGRAAIFLGANQLKIATGASIKEEAAATNAAAPEVHWLCSSPFGLVSDTKGPAIAAVTTGQVVGASRSASTLAWEVGGAVEALPNTPAGGACWIFAAAGTYKVSVKYRATSGKVSAKSRKLWVLAYA